MPQQEVVFDPTLMDSLDEDNTPLPQEFDADADYAAPPPPLPDGWYQAELSCAGVKDESGALVPFRKRPWGQNIPVTFHTSINARIVDPGGIEDGKYASDNTVTTNVDRKRKTSKVAMYYKAITGKPIPGVSEGPQMKALLELLQSKPTVWIRTQLEGQASEASKAFGELKKAGQLLPGEKGPKTFRGEKAFTQEGKLTGRAYDDQAKEFVVGRAAIQDASHDGPKGGK